MRQIIMVKFLDFAKQVLSKSSNRYATYIYYLKLHNTYEFVTFFDFVLMNFEWAKILPHDVDVVVGIPRLGIVSASIASVYLGKSLATVDQLLTKKDSKGKSIEFKKILLVDDSISTGNTIMQAKNKIETQFSKVDIVLAAPYVSIRNAEAIQYKWVVGDEMFFESDLSEHPKDNIGYDIDGVLCEDPPKDAPDSVLAEFYKNAKPKFTPSYNIRLIASGRFEKYRKITEEWLARNGIHYDVLVMRANEADSIEVKVKAIRMYKPFMFFESTIIEAKAIFAQTACRVLCFENKFLYGGKNYGDKT